MKILRFDSREQCRAQHPDAPEYYLTGPIYRYGDKEFIQAYIGQHEWVLIDLEDPTKRYWDPGWIGTPLGYGWATEVPQWVQPLEGVDMGKPDGAEKTVDQSLFGKD